MAPYWGDMAMVIDGIKEEVIAADAMDIIPSLVQWMQATVNEGYSAFVIATALSFVLDHAVQFLADESRKRLRIKRVSRESQPVARRHRPRLRLSAGVIWKPPCASSAKT